jgi:hypothetical protein
MHNIKTAAIGLALTAIAVSPVHANLIADGDFSSGIGTPWYSNASSAGSAWLPGTDQADQGCFSLTASPDQCVDTSAVAASNYLAQSVSGLTVGYNYNLTFEYANGADTFGFPAELTVLWGSNVVGGSAGTTIFDSTTLASGLTEYSVTDLTALDTTMELAFLGAQGNSVAELTDVTLNLAPEPASLSLFTVGVIGIGALRRRKAKRAAA